MRAFIDLVVCLLVAAVSGLVTYEWRSQDGPMRIEPIELRPRPAPELRERPRPDRRQAPDSAAPQSGTGGPAPAPPPAPPPPAPAGGAGDDDGADDANDDDGSDGDD